MKSVSLPGLVFLALVMFFAALGQMAQPFNHDNAVHLHAAGVILEKGSLYTNFFETNPPLFPWMTLAPVWLAKVSGLPEFGLYRLMVFLLAIAVFIVAMGELRRGMAAMGHKFSRRREIVLFGLWGFGFLSLQGYDFGQREHVIALALLPYVLNLGLRLSGGQVAPGRWGTFFFLALAIAIKPFFLPLWVLGEGLVALRRKDPRAILTFGNLWVVTLGVLYLFAVWVFEPAFYENILPMLLSTYSDIRNPLSMAQLKLWGGFTALGLTPLGIFLLRLRKSAP